MYRDEIGAGTRPKKTRAVRRQMKGYKRKSWYCDKCCVEVYQLRCVHCGKSEREPA